MSESESEPHDEAHKDYLDDSKLINEAVSGLVDLIAELAAERLYKSGPVSMKPERNRNS